MADSEADKFYRAEYAKNGRASCKKCKENIAKDSLRMAIMVQSSMYDGKIPHWHHFSCFWQRAAPPSTADIAGYTDLRWEDQDKVKKAIESGGAAGKSDQKSGAKGEKTLNDFAVEYTKSNRSTCKEQIRVSKKAVDPEKPQLGLIDRWYHTACFVSRREELAFKSEYSAAQLKGFNTLRAEDKEELKKRLPAVKSEGKCKSDEVDGVSKKQKKEEDNENKRLEEQLRVSEHQGKVRTYFISTMRSKMSNAATYGHTGERTGGRMTLAGVVFGLVQARHKERLRGTNGGFSLTPCTLQC